jgi:hypothetical protein
MHSMGREHIKSLILDQGLFRQPIAINQDRFYAHLLWIAFS